LRDHGVDASTNDGADACSTIDTSTTADGWRVRRHK
jgi:hypothetical protein